MRKVCILMILFALSRGAPSSFAEEPSGNGQKKNYLKWEAVEGAVSYSVEIRDHKGNLIVNVRTKISEYYFSLKPGEYRVRIGAVNRFENAVSWSDWSPLRIRQPVAPEISSVEPDKLPSSSNTEVIIRGSNFESGTGVVIKTRGRSISLETCRVRDDEKIVCRITTGSDSQGRYSLVVTNPGGMRDTRDVTVFLPRPKEIIPQGKIYLQGGYQIVQVLDTWQAPLHHGYAGFFLRGGFPFITIPLLKELPAADYFYLEGAFSYAWFSSKKRTGIVDSSLHRLIPGIYIAFTMPVAGSRFHLKLRAGGGMAWHILIRDWTFGSPETSHSIDGAVGMGLAVSYQWPHIAFFVGVDYHLVFTGVHFNQSIAYQAGSGYRF